MREGSIKRISFMAILNGGGFSIGSRTIGCRFSPFRVETLLQAHRRTPPSWSMTDDRTGTAGTAVYAYTTIDILKTLKFDSFSVPSYL
jgi:hypothetical protein